ncbi:Ig-like domain-containing protein, partial [Aeromonas veronii]|uniref:Ig-like domain-containing protein n=1 Tax=Aeromonas veronii TaxID=654 RepID=UPI003BA32BFB
MFLRHRLRIALLLFCCLTLLAGCHKNTSSQPSAGGTLQSIDIVAFPLTTIGQASLSLAQGGMQPFVATGYYSDGSTQDLTYEVTWQADNPAVASISQNGELTGVGAGVVSVTASKNGIISNAVVVEITRARIITVAVTPSPVVSKGQPVSMQAIATYDDGSQADITRIATWRSDNPVVATIAPDGVVTGREVGTSGVTASKQGIVSDPVFVEVTSATLDAITITSPSVTLAKGQRRQLQATAIYSDGTQADLTRFATWQSDNMASAAMLPFGVVIGVASGNARVTARFAGVSSGGTAIKVTAAQLSKLNVTPSSVTLAKGLRQSMRAIGTYSDNTQADLTRFVAWRSNNNNVAWVGPDGLLIAVSEGAASINASMEGVSSNAAAVHVTSSVITKLTVSPSPVKIAKGQSSSLRAIATYSDNSQVDITRLAVWRVDDYGVASITVDGAVRGREVGTTTVTSTKDGITSDPVNVDVTSA